MNYTNLTISFQKGRKGTFIAKIMEVPEIVIRGANLAEVRVKVTEAVAKYQKGTVATKQL